MKKHIAKKRLLASLLFALSASFFASAAMAQVEEGQAEKAVWSGYWWPTAKCEIASRLEKYDALTGATSADWHRQNFPTANAASWEGLCHAWAAAAIMEIEPTQAATVGSTELSVGDQKAWLTVCHDSDVSNFYGDRFGDGNGSEDPQDIRPDEFWTVLRSHLRDRKVPIVADIANGSEVWNYPVYAYRVEYRPVNQGEALHRGTIEIWMADDSVVPEFVGVKRAYKKYDFEADIRDGALVMGTGKWIGASANDHPDFVWFPYVAQTSNPQIDYAKVCEFLSRPNVYPEAQPSQPGETEPNPPTPGATPETTSVPSTLKAFLESIRDKPSDFTLDVTMLGLDRIVQVDDEITLRVLSQEEGYLYIFAVIPDGNVVALYPPPGIEKIDNYLKNTDKSIVFPEEQAPYRWRAQEPCGLHHIVAVVVSEPIVFDATESARQKLEKVAKGVAKARFAMDVEPLQIDPAKQTKQKTN